MTHARDIAPGTRVRARVDGWRAAQANNLLDEPDPALPTLDGVPEFVEGELSSHTVDVPEQGIHYVKYIVDGWDVEPEDVEALD